MTWVTDHLFVSGGDLIAETWADFQNQTGITVVVSLRADGPDTFGPPFPLAYLWLPADDAEELTLDAWRMGAQFIDAAVRMNRRLLLHCRLGLHRVRPLFAAYLIHTGKSVKATLREVEERPWMKPYRGQAARLEEFARQYYGGFEKSTE